MVRELSKLLTGVSCDYWTSKITADGKIKYNQCKCGKFIALGKWNPALNCCGVDGISSQKEFNFFERIVNNESELSGEVIFDDGIMNASLRIMNNIKTKYNLFAFNMNYSDTTCFNNILKRGGSPNLLNIQQKVKCFGSTFNNLISDNKYKLSSSIQENTTDIITLTGITPCNCMM